MRDLSARLDRIEAAAAHEPGGSRPIVMERHYTYGEPVRELDGRVLADDEPTPDGAFVVRLHGCRRPEEWESAESLRTGSL